MRILLFFACTLACSVWAADTFSWPSSPRTHAKLQQQWVEFDNIKVPTYTLALGGAKIEVSYFGKFSVGPDDPKWSTTFVIAEQPSVRWGVTSFSKGEFLPDASPANILAYVAGLKSQGATSLITTADGQLEENLMIDGLQPQVVEYTLNEVKTREYFVERQGKIFVFGYQAPVKLYESNAETARIVFARMRFL